MAKGATGKKYKKGLDGSITVTYSDGSTRKVTKNDKSYAVTKAAMDNDVKGYKSTGTSKTPSKVSATNALGKGWNQSDKGTMTTAGSKAAQAKKSGVTTGTTSGTTKTVGTVNPTEYRSSTNITDSSKDIMPKLKTAAGEIKNKVIDPNTGTFRHIDVGKEMNNASRAVGSGFDKMKPAIQDATKDIGYSIDSAYRTMPNSLKQAGLSAASFVANDVNTYYKAAWNKEKDGEGITKFNEKVNEAQEKLRVQANETEKELTQRYGEVEEGGKREYARGIGRSVFQQLPFMAVSGAAGLALKLGKVATTVIGIAPFSFQAAGSYANNALNKINSDEYSKRQQQYMDTHTPAQMLGMSEDDVAVKANELFNDYCENQLGITQDGMQQSFANYVSLHQREFAGMTQEELNDAYNQYLNKTYNLDKLYENFMATGLSWEVITGKTTEELNALYNEGFQNDLAQNPIKLSQDAINKANLGALELGTAEGLTELLGGVAGFGFGVAKPMLKGVAKMSPTVARFLTQSKFGKAAANSLDILSEGVEEGMMDWVQPVVERRTYDPNAENATLEDYAKDGLAGIIAAMIFHTGAKLATGGNYEGNVITMEDLTNEMMITLAKPQETFDMSNEDLQDEKLLLEVGKKVIENQVANGVQMSGEQKQMYNEATQRIAELDAVETKRAEARARTNAETKAAQQYVNPVEEFRAAQAQANNVSQEQQTPVRIENTVPQTTVNEPAAMNNAAPKLTDASGRTAEQRAAETAPQQSNEKALYEASQIYEKNAGRISSTKEKSVMDLRPELKPQIQKMANLILYDMQFDTNGRPRVNGKRGTGITREHSDIVNTLLDDYEMTTAEIKAGLTALVEGNEFRNRADAKKCERMVLQALNSGFRSVSMGYVTNDFYTDLYGYDIDQVIGEGTNTEEQPQENTEPSTTNDIMPKLQTAEQKAGEAFDVSKYEQKLKGMSYDNLQAELSKAALENHADEKLDAISREYDRRSAPVSSDEDIEKFTKYDLTNKWSDASKKWLATMQKACKHTKIEVVDGMKPGENGFYHAKTNTIYINGAKMNDASFDVIREVVGHEVYHSLVQTKGHKDIQDLARKYWESKHPGMKWEDHMIAIQVRYAKYGVILNAEALQDELGAEFVESMFSDQSLAKRIAGEKLSLAEKFTDSVQELLDSINKQKTYSTEIEKTNRLLRDTVKVYRQAMEDVQYVDRDDSGETRHSIQDVNGVENVSFVRYEKSERDISNLFKGSRKEWGDGVEAFINNDIRNYKDVNYQTDDGDIVRLTAKTAWKLKYDKDTNGVELPNEIYRAKLEAASYIDQIIVSSKHASWNEDSEDKHIEKGMAQRGWDYRTAYFEASNGKYYQMKLSVSKNGEVDDVLKFDEAYNLGSIRQRKNTYRSSGSSTREGGAHRSIIDGNASDNGVSSRISDDDTFVNNPFAGLADMLKTHRSLDTEGNELSADQQKYFANSKMRDENGNLKVMYHGTLEPGFKVFGGDGEEGTFFFTDRKLTAKGYSNSYDEYAPKNYSFDEAQRIASDNGYEIMKNGNTYELRYEGDDWVAESSSDINDLIDFIDNDTGRTREGNNYKVYLNIENPLEVDADFNNFDSIPFNGDFVATNDIADYAKENGYDGVIITNLYDDSYLAGRSERGEMTEAIVFNPNQIKSVANEKPTSNTDIRYSLDTDGNELTAAQQEFFKDSKVRDENGNLVVLYHGTRRAGFTQFWSDNGIFLTPNKAIASDYSTSDDEFIPDRPMSEEELAESIDGYSGGDYRMETADGMHIIFDYDDNVVYQTRNLSHAQAYFIDNIVGETDGGDSNYKLYANIRNPYIVEGKGRGWKDLVDDTMVTYSYEYGELFRQIDDDTWEINYSEWGKNKLETFTTDELYDKFGDDGAQLLMNGDIIEDMMLDDSLDPVPRTTDEWVEYISFNETGNDGIIFRDIYDGGPVRDDVYVAFYPEQVKSVANKEPSSDPDIRYSIDAVSTEPQNGTVYDDNGDVVAIQEGTSTRWNLFTYDNGGRDQLEGYLQQLVDKKEIDQDRMVAILNDMDSFAAGIEDIMHGGMSEHFNNWQNLSDAKFRDEAGQIIVSVLKSNGDYSMNLDFSQRCAKRVIADSLMRYLAEQPKDVLDVSKLTPADFARINEIIEEEKLNVACTMCFVETKRDKSAKWANTVASEFNQILGAARNVQPNKFGRITKEAITQAMAEEIATMPGAKTTLNRYKKAIAQYYDRVHATENRIEEIDARDLMHSEGMMKVLQNMPNMYSTIGGRQGSANPKPFLPENMYMNEIITNLKQGTDSKQEKKQNPMTWTFDKAWMVGGVRLQSFSDYRANMIFDYMQMFADLAARKLPIQAYSKVEDFVEIFGMTGAKLNMSLVPGSLQGGLRTALNDVYKRYVAAIPEEKKADEKEYQKAINAAIKKMQRDPRFQTAKKYAGLKLDDNGIPVGGINENGEPLDPIYDWAPESFGYRNGKTLFKPGTTERDHKGIHGGIPTKAYELQNDPRYSPYVGTISIGVSEYHIWTMLFDDNIRMIIPYHKSNINPGVARMKGIDFYNDYTYCQNDKWAKGEDIVYNEDGTIDWRQTYANAGAKRGGYGNSMSKGEHNSIGFDWYKDLKKTKDPQQTTLNYLAWCQNAKTAKVSKKDKEKALEKGITLGETQTRFIIPKFPQFIFLENDVQLRDPVTQKMRLYKAGEVNPYYYKLVEDYDLYDSVTGEYAEQGPVEFRIADNWNEITTNALSDYETEEAFGERGSDRMEQVGNRIIEAVQNKDYFDSEEDEEDEDSGTRHSLDFDKLAEEYGTIEPGENPFGDNREYAMPRKMKDGGNTRRFLRTAAEAKNISDDTVAALERAANSAFGDSFSYTPVSNKSLNDRAGAKIANEGFRKVADQFTYKVESGAKVTALDVATAERCIMEAQKNGDTATAVRLIADVAIVGTEAGRQVQALRMLKRMTPEGQLAVLVRMQNRINANTYENGKLKKPKKGEGKRQGEEQGTAQTETLELPGKAKEVSQDVEFAPDYVSEQTLYPEMEGIIKLNEQDMVDFLNARGETERDELWDKMIADMARQASVFNWTGAINALRYAAMLSNPRTHIRNMLGNMVMQTITVPKNVIDASLEAGYDRTLRAMGKQGIERTKTIKKYNLFSEQVREYLKYAEFVYQNEAKAVLQNAGNKYDDAANAIRKQLNPFGKSAAAQGFYKVTSSVGNALDAEDMAFKHFAFVNEFANYMIANKLQMNHMARSATSNASVERGIEWAIQQAKKATFTEDNSVANMISKLENPNTDNPLVKAGSSLVVGAIMPFKRTPMNILVRGVEYSPAGFLLSAYKLKNSVGVNAKYDAADVIDSFSAGVTGTGIMALGYFLAQMGIIAVGGDDDQKYAKWKREMGEQSFAIVNPDTGESRTIDWLSPTAMPLMAGASLFQTMDRDLGGDLDRYRLAIDALGKITEPAFEMSCLTGVSEVLNGYSGQSDLEKGITAAQHVATGYLGQFIPSPVGAIARSVDDVARSSYAPKDSQYGKTAESFARQQIAKIPGASKKLQPTITMKGEEKKREFAGEGNLLARLKNNLINPWNYSSDKRTDIDREIERLYYATDRNSAVIPDTSIDTRLSLSGQTVYLNPLERTEYAKTLGTTREKYVKDFISSDVYKGMTDDARADMLPKLYELAGYVARKQVADGRQIDIANSKYENALKDGDPVQYYLDKQAEAAAKEQKAAEKRERYAESAKSMGMDVEIYTAIRQDLPTTKAEGVPYLDKELASGNITKEQYWTIRLDTFQHDNKADGRAYPSADDIEECGRQLGRDSELFKKWKKAYNASHKKQVH